MTETVKYNNWNEFIDNIQNINSFIKDTVIIENDCDIESKVINLDSIIIMNLILSDNIKSTQNYFKGFNVKALIINNIDSSVEHLDSMFEGLNASYVKLDLNLYNVTVADSMFANCKVKNLELNIKFSNKLQSAVEMFKNCSMLTPTTINNLITYNAIITDIFKGISFEQALIDTLTTNNKLATLTKEETLYDKLIQRFNATDEHIDKSFNMLNKLLNEQETKLNNIINFKSQIKSKLETVDEQINQHSYNLKAQQSLFEMSIRAQHTLTDLVSRLENTIENMSSRIDELEKE